MKVTQSTLPGTVQAMVALALLPTCSAALVLRLAAEHGDELDAALSFSPAAGAPLADCHPDDFAPKEN